MCGFVGLIRPHISSTDAEFPQDLLKMVKGAGIKLKTRGPDQSGLWSDDSCALAHHRLHVIGSSDEGRQPIRDRTDRYVMVYNGAVYNFRNLGQSLDAVSLSNISCDTRTVIEGFVKHQQDWFKHWKETRLKWHHSLGMGADNYRFHDHEKLAHYADAATDIEFNFPFGFKELEGIHSRTDFDLKAHEEFSGKKLQYFDHEENKSYVPYVVETSIGLDRMFLAVFSNSLQEEALENGTTRTVLKLPAVLAPFKAAIFPLVKKDGLPEVARKIMDDLKWDFNVFYDEN